MDRFSIDKVDDIMIEMADMGVEMGKSVQCSQISGTIDDAGIEAELDALLDEPRPKAVPQYQSTLPESPIGRS
jgi:hypothetical protein